MCYYRYKLSKYTNTRDGKMNTFNSYNTEGYTQSQLDALNNEWVLIVESKDLEEHTEEYDIEFNAFSDQVSKR